MPDFRLMLIVPAACAAFTAGAESATVIETFDYGDQAAELIGQTGGQGWTQPWGNADNSTAEFAYAPTPSLTYGGAGYGNVSNGPVGVVSRRSMTAVTTLGRAFEPMTGTIWISALAQWDTNPATAATDADSVALFLDTSNGNTTGSNVFVGVMGDRGTTGGGVEPYIRYGSGNNDDTNNTDYPANTTHLLLVRVSMDVNASGHDSVDFWVNPTLTGGEAGLGAPAYAKSGANVFGDTFDGLSILLFGGDTGGEQIDALRISNDPDAFAQVLAVPEPGSLAALGGLGGLTMLRRRR